MNKLSFSILCFAMLACISSCKNPKTESKTSYPKKIDGQQLLSLKKTNTTDTATAPFFYTVQPVSLNRYLPALQSFVFASYNGLWIFIGGQKNGFHGTDDDPIPFPSKVANDSIWVVDINQQKSWGVPVFKNLSPVLSATNSAYCQVGDQLYMCGGFTKNSANAANFNTTSDIFLEIDLNTLVQYVESGGTSTNTVITKQIENPYVQVTGGAMVYSNNYFYLIGGQNYDSVYNSGITGHYTNAIRRFSLQQQNNIWIIGDTASLIDAVNLHRRDMNVVPGTPLDPQNVILYGGVFTRNDLAYRNAVFISGLSTGNPTITVDSMQQLVNQYSCATVSYVDASFNVAVTSFLGGITYQMYNADSGKLVTGDNGVPMPFSNIASTIVTGGGINNSVEFIQLPPASPLLPSYMGANAVFIPNPQYALSTNQRLLDAGKINVDTSGKVTIGYLFGGIISMGPTSGTTPAGYVPTYVNPALYKVELNVPNIQ